jgi:serine/threonine-protein kinase
MRVGEDAPSVVIIERFLREAQAAARLHSEHVVRIMDVGALDQGAPFLVLEYLQGCDLEELLRLNGPLDPEDVADYILQALAALAHAHAADIVHRDIKPANIFLAVRPDGSNIIKVLDFGISKQPTSQARWRKLTGETSLGTPAFMSPEQLRNSQGVDPRADIWSLGVVMYELLTGRLPFDGDSPGAAFAAILERDPDPLRTHRADIPPDLEDVVLRCLRRNPEDRFAHVGQLAERLAVHGSGRWTSLVDGIGLTLARSVLTAEAESAALEAAASAIALKSLPPPAREPGDRGTTQSTPPKPGGDPTLKDDPSLKDGPLAAAVGRGALPAPPAAEAKPRRTRLWISAAAVALLGILVLGELRGAPRGSRAAPLAARSAPPTPAAVASELADEASANLPGDELSSSPAARPPATGSAASAPPSAEMGAAGKRARPPKRPSFLRSRD